MDKIWDRNPLKSEVIGCYGGDEKTNGHAEPTKVEHLKIKIVKKSQKHIFKPKCSAGR